MSPSRSSSWTPASSGSPPRLGQHRGRAVDSEHRPADRLRHRDCDAAVPTASSTTGPSAPAPVRRRTGCPRSSAPTTPRRSPRMGRRCPRPHSPLSCSHGGEAPGFPVYPAPARVQTGADARAAGPTTRPGALATDALASEALSAVSGSSTADELDDARVRYLGRKSELKQALREVRDRESGMALNAARERVEEAASPPSRAGAAVPQPDADRGALDITLPGKALRRGHLHPDHADPQRGRGHLPRLA